jgi:hypothetical protein
MSPVLTLSPASLHKRIIGCVTNSQSTDCIAHTKRTLNKPSYFDLYFLLQPQIVLVQHSIQLFNLLPDRRQIVRQLSSHESYNKSACLFHQVIEETHHKHTVARSPHL